MLFADFRADPENAQAAARRPAASSFIPSRSPASATTIARRIRPGSSRRNGWAATSATIYPLHLISSQPRYRLHSQMDPGPVSARGKVAGREAIAINPADAGRRGIADGDVVRVYNARGACLAGAVVTDTVSPGVLRAFVRRLVRSGRHGRRRRSARMATPTC